MKQRYLITVKPDMVKGFISKQDQPNGYIDFPQWLSCLRTIPDIKIISKTGNARYIVEISAKAMRQLQFKAGEMINIHDNILKIYPSNS